MLSIFSPSAGLFFFFSLLFLTLFLKVSVKFVDFSTANTHGVTDWGPLRQGYG